VIISLKEGVVLSTARPECLDAIQACARVVYNLSGHQALTVTSITDGEHGRKSLHRFGLAFDFRTREWAKEEADYLIGEMQAVLGDGYDVILESDHGHCEYDP
jgi:hypothetical protein